MIPGIDPDQFFTGNLDQETGCLTGLRYKKRVLTGK